MKRLPTYRYIWRLMRYRLGLYLWDLISWLVIHLMPLVPGLIVKAFFDRLSIDPGGSSWLAAAALAFALVWVLSVINGALVDILHRFTMSGLLRTNLLQGILRLPGAQPLAEPNGDVLNRFRDDATQIEDAISWTLDFVGTFAYAVVAVIVLARDNARVTLLVFLPLVAVVAVAQALGDRIEKYRVAARDATARVTDGVAELFGGALALKTAGAEERAVAHLGRANDARRHAVVQDRLINEVLESVFRGTVSVGTGLILLLSARAMSGGAFTVGDFALFVAYLQNIADFTVFWGLLFAQYRQAGVALARLADLIGRERADDLVAPTPLGFNRPDAAADADRAGKDSAAAGAPIAPHRRSDDRLERLEARGLTCRHASGRGVSDIDLTIARGTFTIITGRVGAGKTTLLRGLLGLLPCQTGEVRWNGHSVGAPADFMIPPRCAYTPQVPFLFSDSLRANVLLGLPADGTEVDAAIAAAALSEDVAAMADGLDTVVGPRGVRLSGGQLQRAAAARMLARDADLIVFDDLSSALDVETEARLWEGVLRRPGVTCLAVSHRRAALRLADQVIVLKDGRVADAGPLSDLLVRCEEMRQLWQVADVDGPHHHLPGLGAQGPS